MMNNAITTLDQQLIDESKAWLPKKPTTTTTTTITAKCNFKEIEKLVTKGANVNTIDENCDLNNHGECSILHYIIMAPVDPNNKNANKQAKKDCIQFLLENGTDINIQTKAANMSKRTDPNASKCTCHGDTVIHWNPDMDYLPIIYKYSKNKIKILKNRVDPHTKKGNHYQFESALHHRNIDAAVFILIQEFRDDAQQFFTPDQYNVTYFEWLLNFDDTAKLFDKKQLIEDFWEKLLDVGLNLKLKYNGRTPLEWLNYFNKQSNYSGNQYLQQSIEFLERKILAENRRNNSLIQLMQTCKNIKLREIETLYNRGVDINFLSEGSKTLLWHAVKENHSDIVDFLLEKNPDLTIDDEGKSILHIAAESKNVEILKTIIKHFKRLNLDLDEAVQPLSQAVSSPCQGWTALDFALEVEDKKSSNINGRAMGTWLVMCDAKIEKSVKGQSLQYIRTLVKTHPIIEFSTTKDKCYEKINSLTTFDEKLDDGYSAYAQELLKLLVRNKNDLGELLHMACFLQLFTEGRDSFKNDANKLNKFEQMIIDTVIKQQQSQNNISYNQLNADIMTLLSFYNDINQIIKNTINTPNISTQTQTLNIVVTAQNNNTQPQNPGNIVTIQSNATQAQSLTNPSTNNQSNTIQAQSLSNLGVFTNNNKTQPMIGTIPIITKVLPITPN